MSSKKPIHSFWRHIAFALLVISYIIINIFHLGGDNFIFNLNNVLSAPFAVATFILALMVWRQAIVGMQNRVLWAGLTLGWGMWMIAELWWAAASLIGREVPYPSWADFFWIVGYIPMYMAMGMRIRLLPRFNNLAQKVWLAGISLLTFGFSTIFILVPIVQNNAPDALLINTLNLAYPLADLILLLLVLRIFFTYQAGLYGRTWIWLSAGFVLHSFANLFFSYATTAGLYYPDQQVNLISALVIDVPYNLSYLLWGVGLFLLGIMQEIHRPAEQYEIRQPAIVPNTHILVYTKGDDAIISVTKNYFRVFSQSNMVGRRLTEALAISLEAEQTILERVKRAEVLEEIPLQASTHFGEKQILISGIAVNNSQKQYSGATFLVRVFTPDYTLDEFISDQEKGILSYVMNKTGVHEREQFEIKQILSSYYDAHFKAFHRLVVSEGGSILADALVSELKLVAGQNGWQVEIQPNLSIDVNSLAAPDVGKALPVLFQTARQFMSRLTGAASVDATIDGVRARFSETALNNISHFETQGLGHA